MEPLIKMKFAIDQNIFMYSEYDSMPLFWWGIPYVFSHLSRSPIRLLYSDK